MQPIELKLGAQSPRGNTQAASTKEVTPRRQSAPSTPTPNAPHRPATAASALGKSSVQPTAPPRPPSGRVNPSLSASMTVHLQRSLTAGRIPFEDPSEQQTSQIASTPTPSESRSTSRIHLGPAEVVSTWPRERPTTARVSAALSATVARTIPRPQSSGAQVKQTIGSVAHQSTHQEKLLNTLQPLLNQDSRFPTAEALEACAIAIAQIGDRLNLVSEKAFNDQAERDEGRANMTERVPIWAFVERLKEVAGGAFSSQMEDYFQTDLPQLIHDDLVPYLEHEITSSKSKEMAAWESVKARRSELKEIQKEMGHMRGHHVFESNKQRAMLWSEARNAEAKRNEMDDFSQRILDGGTQHVLASRKLEQEVAAKQKEKELVSPMKGGAFNNLATTIHRPQQAEKRIQLTRSERLEALKRRLRQSAGVSESGASFLKEEDTIGPYATRQSVGEEYYRNDHTTGVSRKGANAGAKDGAVRGMTDQALLIRVAQQSLKAEEERLSKDGHRGEEDPKGVIHLSRDARLAGVEGEAFVPEYIADAAKAGSRSAQTLVAELVTEWDALVTDGALSHYLYNYSGVGGEEEEVVKDRSAASPMSPASPSHNSSKRSANNSFASSSHRPPSHTLQVGGGVVFSDELAALDYNSMYVNTDNPYLVLRRMEQQCVEDRSRIERLTKRYDALFSRYVKEKTDLLENNKVYQKYLEMKRSERHSEMDIARLELVRAELIAKTEIMKGALERDEADTLKGEEARLAELKRLLVAVELAQGQKVAITERTGEATSEAARLRGELLAMRGCRSRVDAHRSAAVASLQQLRPANPHAIGQTPLSPIVDVKSPPEVFSRTLSTASASRVAAPLSHKPAQLNTAPALDCRRQTIPSPAGLCPYPIPNLVKGPTHLHDRLFITLPHLFLPVFAPYYAMLTSGRRVEGYRSNSNKAGDSSGSKPQSFAAIMSLASAVLPSRNTSVAFQGDWRALLTLMRRNGNNPLLLLPNAERGPHRGAHSRHKASPSDTQQKTAAAQKRQSAATAGTASSAGSITAANLIALDEGGQGKIGSNDYTANQRRASSASQAMREARRRSSVASTATTASVWTRNRARAASVASTIRVVGNNGRRLSMASTIKSIAKYGGEGATGDLLGLLAPTGNSSSGVQAGGGNKSIISLAAKGGKYSAAPQQLLPTSQQQHHTAAIGGCATNEDANSNLAFGFGKVPHASLPFIGPITSASGHIPQGNTNQAQPARGNQVSGILRTQNKSASAPGVGHANNTGNSEVQGVDQHASAVALGLLQDEVAEGAVYWRNEGDGNSHMLFPFAVAATPNPTGTEATHGVSFQIGDEGSTSQQISAYPFPSERSHLTALAGRIGKAAAEFEQTGDTATADNHPQGTEPLSLSDEEDLPGGAVPPPTQGPASSAAALSWIECWPLLSSLGLASPLPSAPKTLLDQYAVVAAKTTSQHFNGVQSRTATEPSTGTNKRSSVSTFTTTAALPVPLTDGHDLDSTANATITSALFHLLRPLLATNLEVMPPSPAPATTVLEELGGNNRRRESYYYAKDIDVDNDDGIIGASRSVTPKPPTIAEQPSGQGLAPVPVPRLLKVAFGGLLLGSVLPSHPLVNIALEKQVLPTEQASSSTNLTNGAAMVTSAGRHHILSSDPLLAAFPLKAPAAATIEDMSTSHKNNRHKAALLMINRRRDALEYSPSTATMPVDTSSDDEDEGGLSPQNPPLLPLSFLLWGRGGRLMRRIQVGSHSGKDTTSSSSSALLWAFLEALARLDTSLWSPTMSKQALDKELAALGVGNTASHHRIQQLQRELEADEESVRTYFYVPVAPSTAARMLDRLKGSSTSTSSPIPSTSPASVSPTSPTTVASSTQHDAITGPTSQSSPPTDYISVPPIAQSNEEAITFPSAEAISYLHLLHWVATRRVGRYHRHRQHGSTQASVAGADRPGKASERLDKLDMANEEGNDESPADTEPTSEAKHLQQKQLRRALGAPFLEAVDGVLWVSKLDLYMNILHGKTSSPSAFVRPPPLTQPQEEQLALAMQLWLHRCGLGATVGGAYGAGTEGLSSELLPLLRSPVGMADEGIESGGAAATVSIQPILWLASDRRGNAQDPSGYSVVESLACTSSPADAQFLLANMAEVVSSMATAASASEARSVTDALLPFIYKKAMISFDGPLSRPTSPHPQPESSPKSTTPTKVMVAVRSPPPSPKPQPLFGAAPQLPRFASAETRSLHSLRAWLVRHLASPLLLVISATAAASTLSQPLISSSHHPSHTESLHQVQAIAANTRSAADASVRMAEAADQLHAAAGLVATTTYKVLKGAIREYAAINRGNTTIATEAEYKVANAAASPTKTGGPSSPRRASLDGGLQAPMVHVARQALLQALTACFYVTIYPSHHHTTSSSAAQNNTGGAAQMPPNLPQGAGMVPYGETPSEFLAVGGFEHRTPQQSTVAAAQPADALAGLKGASLALPHPHTLPLSHTSEIAMADGSLPFAALPSDAQDDMYHLKEAASLCSWLPAPAQHQLQTLSPPAALRTLLATFAIPQLGSGNLSSTSAIGGGSYVPIGLAASIYSLVLGPTVAFAVGGSGWSGAPGGPNPLRAATMRFNAKASQALTGHQPPLAAPTAPKGLRHFRTDAPSHQQNNTSGLPPASILASSAALHYSPLSIALLKAVGAGSPSAFLSISAGVLPTDNSATASSGYGPSNSSGISYRLPMEYRLVAAANAASSIVSATLQSADGVSPTATNGDNVGVVAVPQRQPRRRGKGGPGVGSGALAATSPNLVGTSSSPAENFFDSLVSLGTEVARQKATQPSSSSSSPASTTVSSMLPASASTIVLAHRKTAAAFVAVVKSLVFGHVVDSGEAIKLLEQHRSMPARRYGTFLASYECYQTMCELLIEAMRAAKALNSIPTYVLPIAPNALHAVDSLRVALQRSFGESAVIPFSNTRRHDTTTTISQRVLYEMDQHALIQCLWGIILQAGRSRWMGRYIAAKEEAIVLGTEDQPPQTSPHHDSYALQRLHLYLTNRGSVALPATTGIPPSKASLAEALAVGVVTSPVSDLVTAATALRRGPEISSLAEVNSIKFSRSDKGGALATDQLLRIALLQVVAGDLGIESDDSNSTNAYNGAAGYDALVAKVSDLWADMRKQMALALSMGRRPGKTVSVRDGSHQFLSSAEFLPTAVTLGEFVAEDSLKLMPPTASINPTASGPLSRKAVAATKGSKRGQAAEPIFEDGLDDDEAGSYDPQGSQLPTEGVGVSDDAALEFLRQVRKPNAFARHMAEIANGERVGLQAHKAAAAAAYSLELTTTVDTKAVGPELKAAAKRIFSSIPFSILGASAANVNALSADPTLASIGSQRSLAHSSSTLSGGNKSTGHSMTNKSIRSVNSTTQQNPLEALLGSTPSLSGSKKLTKKATTLSMASSAFAAATTYSSSSSAVAGGNSQPTNVTGGGGRRKLSNKTPIAKPLSSSSNRLFAASGRWRQLYSLLLRHTIPGGVSAFTTNSVESIVADTISVTTAKQATAAIASQSLLQIGIEAEGSHEVTTMSVASAVADAVAHHLTIDHATWTSHSQRLADRLYATAAAMQDKPKATGYYSSSRASSSAASMTEGEGTEKVANNDEAEGGDVAGPPATGSRVRSSSIKSKVPQRPPGGGSAPVSSRHLRGNRSTMTITNARQMLSEALNSQTTERAPPPHGLVEAYRALQLIDGVRSRATYAVAMAAVCDKQAEVEEDARKRASAANRKAQTKKSNSNPLTFGAPFGAHPSQQSQSGTSRPLSAYEQTIVALAAKPTIVNASSEHYLFDAHVSSSQYGSTTQTSASDGVGAATTAKHTLIGASSSLAKTLMGRKGLSRSAMASSAFGANPSMGRSVGSKSRKGVALMGSKGGSSSKGRARLAFTEPAAADTTGSVIRRGDGSPPPPKRSPPKNTAKKFPTAPAKKSPTTNRDTTPPGEPLEEKGLPTSILVRNKGKKAAPPSPSSGIGSERASAKGKDLRSSSRFPKDEGADETAEDRASVDSSTSAMSSADEGQNPFSISEGEPSHSTTPPPFTFGTSPSPFGVSPQPRGTRSPQPLPPSMGRSHMGRAPFHPMASDGDDANQLRKKFRSKIRKAVTKGASAERPSLWRVTVGGNAHHDTHPRDLGADFATVFYRAAVEGSLPVALLDAAYAQVIEAEIVMRAATGIGGTLSMLSTYSTSQEVNSPLFTSDTARPGSATATLPTNNVPPPSIFSQCSQLSLPHSLTKGHTSQSTERGSPVPSPNGDAPTLASLPPTDEAFQILKAKLLSYLSGKGLLDLLVAAPSPGTRGGGLGSSFLHSPRKTSMFQQFSPHPNRSSIDGPVMSDEGTSVEASLQSLASTQPTLILLKALKAFAAEYNGTSMLNGLALPLDRAVLAALLRVGSPISAQGPSSPSASGVGRYGGAQRLSMSIGAGASTISPPTTANTASALVASMSESPSLNNPRLLLNSFGELHSHLAQHIGGALAAVHAAANPAPAAPTQRIVSTAPTVTLLSEPTFFNNESISKIISVLDPLLSKSLRGGPFWQSQGSALEQSASVVRYLATQAAQQSQRQQHQQPASLAVPGSLWKHRASEDSGSVVMLSQPLSILARLSLPLSISAPPLPAAVAGHQPTLPPRPPAQPRAGLPNNLTALGGNDFMSTSLTNAEGPDAIPSARIVQSVATTAIPLEYSKALPSPQQLRAWCSAAADGHLRTAHTAPQYLQTILSQIRPRPTLGAAGTSPFVSLPHPLIMLMPAPTSVAISSFSSPQQQLLASVVSSLAKRQDALVGYLLDTIVQHGLATITRQEYHRKFEWLKRSAAAARVRDLEHEALKTARSGNYHNKNVSVTGGGGGGPTSPGQLPTVATAVVTVTSLLRKLSEMADGPANGAQAPSKSPAPMGGQADPTSTAYYNYLDQFLPSSSFEGGIASSSQAPFGVASVIQTSPIGGLVGPVLGKLLQLMEPYGDLDADDNIFVLSTTEPGRVFVRPKALLALLNKHSSNAPSNEFFRKSPHQSKSGSHANLLVTEPSSAIVETPKSLNPSLVSVAVAMERVAAKEHKLLPVSLKAIAADAASQRLSIADTVTYSSNEGTNTIHANLFASALSASPAALNSLDETTAKDGFGFGGGPRSTIGGGSVFARRVGNAAMTDADLDTDDQLKMGRLTGRGQRNAKATADSNAAAANSNFNETEDERRQRRYRNEVISLFSRQLEEREDIASNAATALVSFANETFVCQRQHSSSVTATGSAASVSSLSHGHELIVHTPTNFTITSSHWASLLNMYLSTKTASMAQNTCATLTRLLGRRHARREGRKTQRKTKLIAVANLLMSAGLSAKEAGGVASRAPPAAADGSSSAAAASFMAATMSSRSNVLESAASSNTSAQQQSLHTNPMCVAAQAVGALVANMDLLEGEAYLGPSDIIGQGMDDWTALMAIPTKGKGPRRGAANSDAPTTSLRDAFNTPQDSCDESTSSSSLSNASSRSLSTEESGSASRRSSQGEGTPSRDGSASRKRSGRRRSSGAVSASDGESEGDKSATGTNNQRIAKKQLHIQPSVPYSNKISSNVTIVNPLKLTFALSPAQKRQLALLRAAIRQRRRMLKVTARRRTALSNDAAMAAVGSSWCLLVTRGICPSAYEGAGVDGAMVEMPAVLGVGRLAEGMPLQNYGEFTVGRDETIPHLLLSKELQSLLAPTNGEVGGNQSADPLQLARRRAQLASRFLNSHHFAATRRLKAQLALPEVSEPTLAALAVAYGDEEGGTGGGASRAGDFYTAIFSSSAANGDPGGSKATLHAKSASYSSAAFSAAMLGGPSIIEHLFSASASSGALTNRSLLSLPDQRTFWADLFWLPNDRFGIGAPLPIASSSSSAEGLADASPKLFTANNASKIQGTTSSSTASAPAPQTAKAQTSVARWDAHALLVGISSLCVVHSRNLHLGLANRQQTEAKGASTERSAASTASPTVVVSRLHASDASGSSRQVGSSATDVRSLYGKNAFTSIPVLVGERRTTGKKTAQKSNQNEVSALDGLVRPTSPVSFSGDSTATSTDSDSDTPSDEKAHQPFESGEFAGWARSISNSGADHDKEVGEEGSGTHTEGSSYSYYTSSSEASESSDEDWSEDDNSRSTASTDTMSVDTDDEAEVAPPTSSVRVIEGGIKATPFLATAVVGNHQALTSQMPQVRKYPQHATVHSSEAAARRRNRRNAISFMTKAVEIATEPNGAHTVNDAVRYSPRAAAHVTNCCLKQLYTHRTALAESLQGRLLAQFNFARTALCLRIVSHDAIVASLHRDESELLRHQARLAGYNAQTNQATPSSVFAVNSQAALDGLGTAFYPSAMDRAMVLPKLPSKEQLALACRLSPLHFSSSVSSQRTNPLSHPFEDEDSLWDLDDLLNALQQLHLEKFLVQK